MCQAALLSAAYTLLYAIPQKRYIFLKKNFLSMVNVSNSNGWTSIKFFECRILPVKNLTTDKQLQMAWFQCFYQQRDILCPLILWIFVKFLTKFFCYFFNKWKQLDFGLISMFFSAAGHFVSLKIACTLLKKYQLVGLFCSHSLVKNFTIKKWGIPTCWKLWDIFVPCPTC